MWTTRLREMDRGRVQHHRIALQGEPVPYDQVIHLWIRSPEFRSFFLARLAEAPFDAFRWETPPVTTATADRPFEFVLVDSPWLAVPPDESPFAEHFRSADLVVTFPNLGHDAVLVAPCPPATPADYTHLAAFLREAPEVQQHEFRRKVGLAMQVRLGPDPVWLSTAGGGVDWLHVRLDDRPKYYSHAPYRTG